MNLIFLCYLSLKMRFWLEAAQTAMHRQFKIIKCNAILK